MKDKSLPKNYLYKREKSLSFIYFNNIKACIDISEKYSNGIKSNYLNFENNLIIFYFTYK